MIVSIHQPNFFPWLGFFDKIEKADVFIILDDVQLPKTGGTWSNRVKIIKNGLPKWMTVPINRNYSGTRAINQSFFNDSYDWRNSIIGTIQSNYNNSTYFNEVFSVLKHIIEFKNNNIAAHNINAIYSLSKTLGIDTNKFILSSDISYDGHSSEMLVSLVKLAQGNSYLCGGGSKNYLDKEVFKKEGVEIFFQDFIQPEYSQKNTSTFAPGLSIIDAVMNLGWQETKILLDWRKN